MKVNAPNRCIIELTRICNMRCIHCASSAGNVRPSGELRDEEMNAVIDEAHHLGVKDMVFSGGEPLLRKNWANLAARVRDYGMKLGMVSNGTYVKENATPIARYTTGFSMSLDGLEETHNFIRQSKNAFKDVVEAFREMARREVCRFAITSVSRLNIDELEGIYSLLKELEVTGWQVQLTFSSGRMKEQNQQICLPKDVKRIVNFLVNVRREGILELHTGDNIGYFTADEKLLRRHKWNGCHAGISAVSVEADGNVKGCLCLVPEYIEGKHFVEGNVKNRSLRDIWFDNAHFSYNRTFEIEKVRGFCRCCPHLSACRCGCTAFAFYVSGTKYDNPYCLYRIQSTER